jgi:hypothetical protein
VSLLTDEALLLLRAYIEVFDDPLDLDQPTDREIEIAHEVREVRDAKSLAAACNVIEWWGGWSSKKQMRDDVARLRAILGKLDEGRCRHCGREGP